MLTKEIQVIKHGSLTQLMLV